MPQVRDENIPDEKVNDVPEIEAGSYYGVLGKTYYQTGGTKSLIISDFFLVNRTQGETSVKLMDLPKIKENQYDLRFFNDKNNKLQIEGAIFQFLMFDPNEDSTARTKNFLLRNRRHFARKFKAYDETMEIIRWGEVQKALGRFIDFNLVKNGNYINLDIDSFNVYKGGLNPEVLEKLYADVAVTKMDKQQPDEAPDRPTSESKPEEKQEDDLPF